MGKFPDGAYPTYDQIAKMQAVIDAARRTVGDCYAENEGSYCEDCEALRKALQELDARQPR